MTNFSVVTMRWSLVNTFLVVYCNVVLEAVADYDLCIWHSFFGMAGSHNDINVL
jgi:hypothetical protein